MRSYSTVFFDSWGTILPSHPNLWSCGFETLHIEPAAADALIQPGCEISNRPAEAEDFNNIMKRLNKRLCLSSLYVGPQFYSQMCRVNTRSETRLFRSHARKKCSKFEEKAFVLFSYWFGGRSLAYREINRNSIIRMKHQSMTWYFPEVCPFLAYFLGSIFNHRCLCTIGP